MRTRLILAGECALLAIAFVAALVIDLAGYLCWQRKWRA